ncbi:hypothetical protein [Ruegeria arenilitoris]|uniref:hypothetical protein n=1 Tax=Ruegeria arenilitoris TaxID=1173585 RepID=UPI001C2CB8A9|nr:hypothetical protein [Ruegeria arenilitoris]
MTLPSGEVIDVINPVTETHEINPTGAARAASGLLGASGSDLGDATASFTEEFFLTGSGSGWGEVRFRFSFDGEITTGAYDDEPGGELLLDVSADDNLPSTFYTESQAAEFEAQGYVVPPPVTIDYTAVESVDNARIIAGNSFQNADTIFIVQENFAEDLIIDSFIDVTIPIMFGSSRTATLSLFANSNSPLGEVSFLNTLLLEQINVFQGGLLVSDADVTGNVAVGDLVSFAQTAAGNNRDDASIAPVPLPATIWLLGLAFSIMVLVRKSLPGLEINGIRA